MAFRETTLSIDLRWRDMDMLGHLNQAVYHELLEEGRGALISEAGPHFAFVLARVELDYRLEVRRDHGPVDVVSRATELGRRKVVVAHELRRASGELAAAGTSVLVCWDPKARASRDLTPEERTALGG
ncbi:MAG: acyl-CoA thioesterase [Solirubrobacterales bacterium]|nr:acyl-CoA thioesterase [Solirubrobacterales bacterium]